MRHHLCVFLLFMLWFVTVSAKAGSSKVKSKPEKEPRELIELDDKNWTQILEGDWFVAFHAPWCPACRDFLPEFKSFAQYNRGGENFKVAVIDIHKYPGLSGRFLISALPTIYHVKDGIVRQYTGIRDRERMNRYLDQHGWDDVAPVSDWLHPNSAHMAIAGSFFELSMKLKDIHTWMVEEKGIPTWITYAIFGIGTISLGGIIGIVLVFIIETISGRRKGSVDKLGFSDGRIKPTKSRSSSAGSHTGTESDEDVGAEGKGHNDGERTASTSEGEDSGDQGKGDSEPEGAGEAGTRRRKVRRED